MYVGNELSSTVSVIDTASNTVIATVPVGQTPFGVAVHPDGTRVYIANINTDNVSVIDTASNTVIATIPVGSRPFAFGQFIGPLVVEPSTLTNISTRAFVTTGDNVEIGGFIISGTTSKTVLIRGRGPSLSGAPFNIPGTLANPFMKLFSFASGTFIAQNDNWQMDDPLCASSGFVCGGEVEIIATGLDPCMPNPGQSSAPPACAQESAILITLPPGQYGAIMNGVNNETGIGLVEVFEVP